MLGCGGGCETMRREERDATGVSWLDCDKRLELSMKWGI